MADTRRSGGDLRWRVRLERRSLDANGDPLGDWVELCTVAACRTNLRGGEEVMAQRLEGVQTAAFDVRAFGLTRSLTTADRLVDVRAGQVFDIRDVSEDPRRMWITILGQSKAGGTVG